jgi:signal transduction histidine kinase
MRTRLLLLIVFVLLVTGSLAAWFASQAVRDRFEQYLVYRQEESRDRREHLATLLPAVFADHYARTGTWVNAEALVQGFSLLAEEQIVLSDPQGQVLADSGGPVRAAQQGSATSPLLPITVDGQVVGAVQIPETPLVSNSSSENAFLMQVNRSLLLAILAAGLVAVVLTLALTHGILRRVSALTTAVQKMEQGDLSQRVQNGARDEIGQLAHAFNAMADSLARIEQLRRNMVSDVAHELRTPLSNIRGYLEAVQDELLQPTPELITSLHEETMLLHRLISDLQELAVAEAGQLKLARQPMTVAELVEKALQSMHCQVNGSRELRVELASSLPQVHVDAERIGQVLRNLLNNAVEHTPTGGVITVGARLVDGAVQLNVYNDGAGIAPEHLPNVFERFYRVDHSRSRATGGSGLGLAIVKNLVEAHGGRVWVESEAGHFANFYFTLPTKS